MKKLSKIWVLLIMFIVIIGGNVISVEAASFSVSASKTTVKPGETVNISVSSSGGEGAFEVSSVSGVTKIWSGETTSVKAPSSGSSFTITIKNKTFALSDGSETNLGSKSISIKITSSSTGSGSTGSGSTGSGSTGSGSTGSGSTGNSSTGSNSSNSNSNSTPEEEDTRSTNNKLASLTVSEGTLSPKFAGGTTSYEVNVQDVDTIKISASAADSKASVSGTGTKELKFGANDFSVVVKAENGSTKTYKITVTMDQSPTVFADYAGEELGVVKNTATAPKVEYAEETKVFLGEDEIPAWNVTTLDMTIVYMIDSEGNKDYYIYEDGVITSKFAQAAILGRNLVLIDIPQEEQVRTGMIFQEVTVDEVIMNGWVYEDPVFDNYIVIRVMEEQGQMVEYLYSISENAMILKPAMAAVTEESIDLLYDEMEVTDAKMNSAVEESQAASVELEEAKSYMIIAFGIAGLLLLALIIVLIVGTRKRKMLEGLLAEYEDIEAEYLEEDDYETAEIFDVEDDVDTIISDWHNQE